MTTLQGYQLKASRPNAQGLCAFKLIKGTEEIKIDRPCTLDEALAAARRFIAQEEQEKRKKKK